MTVAELEERMSDREYECWKMLYQREHDEQIEES